MSDYGDFCREHRRHKQAQNQKRYDRNMRELREIETRDARFRYYAIGSEYRVTLGALEAKFWPSTGSTIFRFGRNRTTQRFTARELYCQLLKLHDERKAAKAARAAQRAAETASASSAIDAAPPV